MRKGGRKVVRRGNGEMMEVKMQRREKRSVSKQRYK